MGEFCKGGKFPWDGTGVKRAVEFAQQQWSDIRPWSLSCHRDVSKVWRAGEVW